MSTTVRPGQRVHYRHIGDVPTLSRRRCSPNNSDDEDLNVENIHEEPEPSSSRRVTTATSVEYMNMPKVVEPVQPKMRYDNAQVEKVTPQDLEKLKDEIEELVQELKKPRRYVAPGEYQDIQEEFLRRLYSPGTIKYYTGSENGFKILQNKPADPEAIRVSKLNILDFVYRQSSDPTELSPLITDILEKVDSFIARLETSELRKGAFSVAVDFSDFPPSLTSRVKHANGSLQMLRPVVVDGVAVHYASSSSTFRPFHNLPEGITSTKQVPWAHFLNLSVKPLFHMIVTFLIRGHNTKVYLPRYYQDVDKCIQNGGVSRVDDIYAFKKLVDLGFIEFRDIQRSERNWFTVMTRVVDKLEGVFISSTDFRKLRPNPTFEKPSDRILTPCFLNDQDRLMVLEPTIRYRDQNGQFQMIPAEKTLTFEFEEEDRNAPKQLESQLYLHDQIRLICELCQVYPMKSIQKVSIQKLLLLCLRADSRIEMPGMEEEDYKNLKFDQELEAPFE